MNKALLDTDTYSEKTRERFPTPFTPPDTFYAPLVKKCKLL